MLSWSEKYSPMKIGIWSSSTQHEPNGLTPFSRKIRIWSAANACLSSPCFALSALSCGASACILRPIIACLRLSGNIIARTMSVSKMMDRP